jgi:hypothetical protein
MEGESVEREGSVEVGLPTGANVRVRVAEPLGAADGLGSVGRLGPLDLREALAPITEVADLVRERLDSLTATRATVEFGVSFEVASGKLVALVFEGKGAASLTVSLEWERTGGDGASGPN